MLAILTRGTQELIEKTQRFLISGCRCVWPTVSDNVPHADRRSSTADYLTCPASAKPTQFQGDAHGLLSNCGSQMPAGAAASRVVPEAVRLQPPHRLRPE